MWPTKKAFVLMEVLPALGLFLLVLSVVLRFVWIAGEAHILEQQRERSMEALSLCASEAASGFPEVLLVWEEDMVWQLRRFPDVDWLPTGGDRRNGFLFERTYTETGINKPLWILKELR